MSNDRHTNSPNNTLDAALNALPRDIEPSRDLWPQIRAEIETTPRANTWRSLPNFKWQIAAALVLVIGSSAITYTVTRYAMQSSTALTSAASSGDQSAIAIDYLRSRAALDKQFATRIASLPPAMRAKLESNLADLRRAENDIVANLAQHPSDPLLHELLLSTYQSEAQLLADASALSQSNS